MIRFVSSNTAMIQINFLQIYQASVITIREHHSHCTTFPCYYSRGPSAAADLQHMLSNQSC
jgi:hypothetical protein